MTTVAAAAPPTDASDDRPVGVAISAAYLPELESLRGIAALLVMAFHYDGWVMAASRAPSGEWCALPYAFIRGGHAGVNLFFVLSAFLLSLPFLAAADGGPPVSPRRYAARRALRILPLYYFVVIVGSLATAATAADVTRGLPYLFFLNGIGGLTTPMRPFSNVWWSLATEMQFYLVLPLLPFALRTWRGRAVGLALLGAYAIAYVLYERRVILTPTTIAGMMALGLSLFGRGPIFLCGIAAAALYRRHGAAWRSRFASVGWLRAGGADALLLGLLAALAVYLRWLDFLGAARYHAPPYHAWHALGGPLWAALTLLILLAPLRLKPLLHNRWLTRLGVLSYSIYVLHIPVIQYVATALNSLGVGRLGWYTGLLLTVSTVLCIGIATLTYRFIEAPFLRRKETVRG